MTEKPAARPTPSGSWRPDEAARDLVRRRVIVHGRVQGVFFRAQTADRARRRGLAGWVRNNVDGTVEAVVEGEAQAVDELLAFMHRGPRGARVERVEIGEEPPERLRDFDVA